MHIFFSGIGGTAIGPLSMIAKQAGHEVSGSDKQDSQYISYLKSHGVPDISIGQTRESIEALHRVKPIDWFVYSSAISIENPNHPELQFVTEQGIKHSKRDALLNSIIKDRQLKLIAIAGTHGKTTTTAMAIWLMKSLNMPVSYSLGAKIDFGEMGQYDSASEYFVLEADEFDRNFLSFTPYMSAVSGIAYDHQEIYPTEEAYRQAFRDFLGKSAWRILWKSDSEKLLMEHDDTFVEIPDDALEISKITLAGTVNRRNAWLVINTVNHIAKQPVEQLIEHMNKFPGVSRRMEPIKDHLYTDYAHTPEKVAGALEIASELASKQGRELIVVYEPLTNRRLHHTISAHNDLFNGVTQLYWVPSYLAREDPEQPILTPSEAIARLSTEAQAKASPAELNNELKKKIKHHMKRNGLVLCLSGGGGGSLDEWLRKQRWTLF